MPHSTYLSGAAAAVAALALAGGAAAPAVAANTAPAPGGVAPSSTAPAASGASSPDGVWRVTGYGAVLSVEGTRLREYQTTAAGCLPGDSATRTAPGTYRTGDGTVLTVEPARHALRVAGSPGFRELRRTTLPAACTQAVPTDPLTTFDVFWQTFAENYPFFAAKGVDWQAVRAAYRPQVHADTTRDQLFALFSAMVRPLYDAHVAVIDGDRHFAEPRPGTTAPGPELDAKTEAFVVRRDLGGHPLREFAGGRIGYADLPGGLGYLRVSGFTGYAGQDQAYAPQRAVLDKALDTVLTAGRAGGLKGLVIDLRVNGGGYDSLGLRIAQRLTDTPYRAYRKRTRYTAPQRIAVRPAAGVPRYTGPVAVLTSGSTVSAGETFTQALIDRPGGSVRVGQPTQGVFSDVMDRRLPNGMDVWLPNEEFLNDAGRTFDGTGIPPQLATPVFTPEEFAHDRDSAFDAAVALLRGRPARS